MRCLDENAVLDVVEGKLPADSRAAAERHLDECQTCRRLIAEYLADGRTKDTQPQRDSEPGGEPVISELAATTANVKETTLVVPTNVPHRRALLAPETMVDHFRVRRLLGRGGMGEVYLARDTKLGREVALKMVRKDLLHSQRILARFQREARATAKLSHPNIVTIHAFGEYSGAPYFALEYLRGQTLRERLSERPFSQSEALRTVIAITDALHHAHLCGVLHRDLKPSNVHLAEDGSIRVLDFGLAKIVKVELRAETYDPALDELTAPGSKRGRAGCMGTPFYMAPEQWRKSDQCAATDIWALGVILYELVFDRLPFAADDLVQQAALVSQPDIKPDFPTDVEVPSELCEIIARCFNPEPSGRPSADELKTGLDSLLSVVEPPKTIAGKYRLHEPLGAGGMGAIWKGFDLRLEVPVAVKFMHSDLATETTQRVRFEREAKACAQIRSPHVVHIYDHGIEGNKPYIVMEYLEGETLGQRFERVGIMSPAEVNRICGEICKGLHRAHSLAIVHRDLKFANVFLSAPDDDLVKLLDFGIAKASGIKVIGSETTTSGIMLGSPFYMSPEQVRGLPLDCRADLWALAVILYRLLTTHRPFDGTELGDLAVRICSDPVTPPTEHVAGLPSELDRFFEKAFVKEPADRFQTAREFADAFAAASQDHPMAGTIQPRAGESEEQLRSTTNGTSSDQAPARQTNRTRRAMFVAAATLLFAGAGLALLWDNLDSPTQGTAPSPTKSTKVPSTTASKPPRTTAGSSATAPTRTATSAPSISPVVHAKPSMRPPVTRPIVKTATPPVAPTKTSAATSQPDPSANSPCPEYDTLGYCP